MGVPAFKIGSGECNNYPLIEHIARKGKPIILSTGMNDIDSVRPAVEIIQALHAPLALMHCTSMYPTPYDKVRLGAMSELSKAFPDLPVGLSDHSLNIWTCLGAVALGATILEKHVTCSRDGPGPDIGISIEPDELARLIEGSRAIALARGGRKTILDEEMPVANFAYASVVSVGLIKAGEKLSLDNIWVKRPGTGPYAANRLDYVLGRIAARDIREGMQITPEDIVETPAP